MKRANRMLRSCGNGINTLSATIAKEIRIFTRYIPNLIGTTVQLALRVVFFFFLSSFATYQSARGALEGKELFVFYGAALLMYVFYSSAIWAPLNSVTADLYNGTLEYIYITPASKFSYYFGTGLSNVSINMVFFIPMFVGLSVYSGAGAGSILMSLLCTAVGIVNCIAIGVLISLLGLLWKQVGSITGIISVLFEFLAGAYAPVQSYPEVVKWFAYLLPFTWGYDLTRHYFLGDHWVTLLPVPLEWLLYMSMAALYLAVGVAMMRRIQKKVLNTGLNMI